MANNPVILSSGGENGKMEQISVMEQIHKQIPAETLDELKKKFEDEEVLEFMLFNFKVEELLAAQIIHPTLRDPVVEVNGKIVAMWL